MKFSDLLLSTVLFLLPTLSLAMPSHILLIRHAEKPTQGAEGSELSEKGWQRAKALPDLFNNRPELANLGSPTGLFAMAPQKPGGSIRAIQTLKYVAESFQLMINSNFKRDDFSRLVETLKNDPTLENHFVVVCWERQILTDIAFALGVRSPPTLSPDQFDRAWLLSYSQNGTLESFQDFPQNLLPEDSQSSQSF